MIKAFAVGSKQVTSQELSYKSLVPVSAADVLISHVTLTKARVSRGLLLAKVGCHPSVNRALFEIANQGGQYS